MKEEQWNKVKIINNTYKEDLSIHEYAIQFGNAHFGYSCSKDILPAVWLHSIRISKSTHPGDVALFYKGEIIRSLWNGEKKMKYKNVEYPYTLNKYKYEKFK